MSWTCTRTPSSRTPAVSRTLTTTVPGSFGAARPDSSLNGNVQLAHIIAAASTIRRLLNSMSSFSLQVRRRERGADRLTPTRVVLLKRVRLYDDRLLPDHLAVDRQLDEIGAG